VRYATSKNKYKIIAKYLEIPVKNKKKTNKDKLNKTRNDIIRVFIDRPFTLMQKTNLQQIAKASGIFFKPDSISIKGKNQILEEIKNKVKAGTTIFSINDVPAFEKLQEFSEPTNDHDKYTKKGYRSHNGTDRKGYQTKRLSKCTQQRRYSPDKAYYYEDIEIRN
jgi:hypothetical protein